MHVYAALGIMHSDAQDQQVGASEAGHGGQSEEEDVGDNGSAHASVATYDSDVAEADNMEMEEELGEGNSPGSPVSPGVDVAAPDADVGLTIALPNVVRAMHDKSEEEKGEAEEEGGIKVEEEEDGPRLPRLDSRLSFGLVNDQVV